jgi:hypothetical protein
VTFATAHPVNVPENYDYFYIPMYSNGGISDYMTVTSSVGYDMLGQTTQEGARSIIGAQEASEVLTEFKDYVATLNGGNTYRKIITYAPDGDSGGDEGTERFWGVDISDATWNDLGDGFARYQLYQSTMIFYRTASVAVAASSRTEIEWTADDVTNNNDVRYQSVVRSGNRVMNTYSPFPATLDVSAVLVLDGATDLMIEWVLSNSALTTDYAPAGDDIALAPAPIRTFVSVKEAGRCEILGPRNLKLTTGGDLEKLRLFVTAIAGSTTRNVTAASIHIRQNFKNESA